MTVEATAPAVAPETAAEPGANAAEVSPSLTVQTPDAEVAPAQARASLLKAFTTGTPVELVAPPVLAPALFTTGKRDDWTDGEGGVEALVLVELFKATLKEHTHFGYKGTIITAPEAVVERGIRFGALSKEF